MNYADIPGLNWSLVKHARRSLLHFRAAETDDSPDEPTDAMRIGTATHVAILEPMRLPLEVAVWSGGTRRGKEWDAFVEANANRTILREEDYLRAVAIGEAVRAHPIAGPLLVKGEAEVALTWRDRASALDLKSRLDWVRAPMAFVELKTARMIDLRRFSGAAWSMGYFHQVAFYRRGMADAAGCSREAVTVHMIAVENTPPFDVLVSEPDADSLDKADEEIDALLAKVAEARRSGEYPGAYAERVEVLRAPVYVLEDDYDFEVTEREAV